MKKIFVYIGSGAGESSNTVFYVKSILDKVVRKTQNQSTYELFTPRDVNIQNCRSCNSCFYKGTCPLDDDDDMLILKKKMLEADFIIWGSPVYAHNVTGNMKVFIDRITYWMHLMRLVGKPGVVLSTASSNGSIYVDSYLYRIMSHLGIKVVGKFTASVHYPNHLKDEKFLTDVVGQQADIICDYILDNKDVDSDETLEALFQSYKKQMKGMESMQTAEHLFWRNNGYFECNNFGELLKRRRLLE